jgi:cytochrome P450
MMAGTLTTAWTLEVSTFYLLRRPEILRRLKDEIHATIPNLDEVTPLPVLEQLPYFNAVIKESLRLTYGVAGRLARIAPDQSLILKDGKKVWTIPPGTPVGMSAGQIHHDENIFPNSKFFDPERWLENGKLHSKLDKYLIPFTRGSRQCLGMNLAFAELYLCMSALWGRYGSKSGVTMEGEPYEGVRDPSDIGVMELYETGMRDVEIAADSFLPLVWSGSKGIRVKVSQ